VKIRTKRRLQSEEETSERRGENIRAKRRKHQSEVRETCKGRSFIWMSQDRTGQQTTHGTAPKNYHYRIPYYTTAATTATPAKHHNNFPARSWTI